jgi:GNAT superfamily N-acetyltransferase
MRIEPLNKNHDRAAFDCGHDALNTYLRETARQHAERNLSRSFVLTDSDPEVIISYATLVTCEVEPTDIPATWAKRYPYRLPAARLARLATDHRYTRRGYGAHLLVDMLRRVAESSRNVGFVGLFVDAKTDGLAEWYASFGFVRLTQNPLTLFMAHETIEAALKAE